MKVVVIGAAGHIGTYLVPMLADAGFETVAVTRTLSTPYEDAPAWHRVGRVLMDRDDPGFVDALAAMAPDVVVDLVNFSPETTRAMVEGLSSTGLTHYLFCSTCWTHGRAELEPFDPDDLKREPLDDYGRAKLECELYLKERWLKDGFPATIVQPGQISGPGWEIIGPWGNMSLRVFQDIADDKPVALANFGQEIIHIIHGYDVAQVFFRAVTHRTQALGEAFSAEAAQSVTTYGYAKHLYEFFGHESKIEFLPWPEWCAYEGNEAECEASWLHLARSGTYSIEKERRLLGYEPKYGCLETIDLAVRSFVERGLIKVAG